MFCRPLESALGPDLEKPWGRARLGGLPPSVEGATLRRVIGLQVVAAIAGPLERQLQARARWRPSHLRSAFPCGLLRGGTRNLGPRVGVLVFQARPRGSPTVRGWLGRHRIVRERSRNVARLGRPNRRPAGYLEATISSAPGSLVSHPLCEASSAGAVRWMPGARGCLIEPGRSVNARAQASTALQGPLLPIFGSGGRLQVRGRAWKLDATGVASSRGGRYQDIWNPCPAPPRSQLRSGRPLAMASEFCVAKPTQRDDIEKGDKAAASRASCSKEWEPHEVQLV